MFFSIFPKTFIWESNIFYKIPLISDLTKYFSAEQKRVLFLDVDHIVPWEISYCGWSQNPWVFQVDGTWEIETSTLVKSHRLHFSLNQEVEDTTMDGRNVLCTFQLIGPNRLLETQTFGSSSDKRQTTIERQFSPRGMSVILKVGNVIAYSNFARKMN